jgi:hypothetical protein
MPGCHACDGGDAGARGRDFQARAIGNRVVDRQGIELSLVALQPWQAAIVASLSWKCAFVVRVTRLRCPPGLRCRPPGKPSSSGTQSIHAGHRNDPARTGLSGGSTFEMWNCDVHCLDQ